MSVEQVEVVLPNDPVARKSISGAIQEISDYKIQIESFRECIKDVVESISEKYNIPKKTVNQLANVYHKQNKDKIEQESTQLIECYELLFESDGQHV